MLLRKNFRIDIIPILSLSWGHSWEYKCICVDFDSIEIYLLIENNFISKPGATFTNIPILVSVLTLVVYHFNYMPDFIYITVSTILALKS